MSVNKRIKLSNLQGKCTIFKLDLNVESKNSLNRESTVEERSE